MTSDGSGPTRRTVVTAVGGAATGVAGCGARPDGGSKESDRTTGTGADPSESAASPARLPRPTWTTGEKHGVVTAGRPPEGEAASRVWATLTRGGLTEARFPRVDALQLRRLSYLLTDGDTVWRTATGPGRADDGIERTVERVVDDALAFRQTFTTDAWSLKVEYAADPTRDTLVADVTLDAPAAVAVYAVARPAVSHGTVGDRSRVDDGTQSGGQVSARDTTSYLTGPDGESYPTAVALAAADGFEWATAAPADDPAARRLLAAGTAVAAPPVEATDDAVLAGRLGRGSLSTTLAVGFAGDADTAAATDAATASLDAGFETVRTAYRASWERFLDSVTVPDAVAGDETLEAQYAVAAMTLDAVEDRSIEGAGIASPSVPWGSVIAADEPSDVGYNFVWSRDLYQSFTAWEAMGRVDAARAATEYLLTVQQREGGFLPQNTFVDGRTRWGGQQLDNVAFPLVMAHQLRERHGVWETTAYDYDDLRASATYLARNGPSSQQERWEEESGISPSTVAAVVAGLVCAAREADRTDHTADALVWLAVADAWRDGVREWCVTREGVAGHDPPYYFRVAADRTPDRPTERSLANGGPTLDERAIVDAGFLELVRLGLYPADDPVVANSVRVVDETIRVETPNGPGWYRYNGDGYGEGVGPGAADQFDATADDFGAPWPAASQGKGRLWPLLTAERAEYELRRETPTDGTTHPERLLRTVARFAHPSGMLPEQVWDRPEPSPYGWTFGEGTASATPLAWSMAAFVRLAHGVTAGRPVETPTVVADRYADPPTSPSLTTNLPATVDSPSVTVSGRTDAAKLFVRTPVETVRTTVSDGQFSLDAPLAVGRNTVFVVAADPADPLLDSAVALERSQIVADDG